MNKKVFYKDGTIIEVERGNSYLKRQIKINQYYNGYVPYKFTPYTKEEIEIYWEDAKC